MLRRLIFVIVPVAFLVACDQPVATWHMDETSGTTMVDSAGNHDGRLTNVQINQPGVQGRAYRFNGSSSIIRVPDAADLDPGTADFTYSAWIKTTVLPPATNSDIVRKGLSTTSAGAFKMEIFPVNGSARARCYIKGSSGDATAGGGNNLQNGAWHHIVCAYRGTTISLTIDGKLVKSATAEVGSVSNSSEVTIGGKPTLQDFYNGLIDDVQITIG